MKIVNNLKDLDYGPDYEKQHVAAGKYFLKYHTGYVGCDGYDFIELQEPWPVKEFDDAVWQAAVEHAGAYGIEPPPETYEDEDGNEDYSRDRYSDSIEGYAANYNPDLHDAHNIGGTPHFTKWY